MNTTILAIRAITSEYALQLLRPLLLIGIGIYAVVLALIIWIAYSVSFWWLLLAIIPTILIIVGMLLWIIVYSLAKRLSPLMIKEQSVATKKFVRHIGKAAENLGTPRFVLIFRIIKDIITQPRDGKTYIGELAQTPGEMRRDFEELRRLF